MSKILIQPPATLTLLTTFKCTAACKNILIFLEIHLIVFLTSL